MQNQVYSKAMRIKNHPYAIPYPFQTEGNRLLKTETSLSFFFAISKNLVSLLYSISHTLIPRVTKAVNSLAFKSESSTFI